MSINILVIHPFDTTTTDFITSYDLKSVELINLKSPQKQLIRSAIKRADRIVCIGHGDPNGLYRVPFNQGYIIDSQYVQLLREKECIMIWCYASEWMKKYNIKGFGTGMFISDMNEALTYRVPFIKKQIDESNHTFACALAKSIRLPINQFANSIITDYSQIDSPIANFNISNFYNAD